MKVKIDGVDQTYLSDYAIVGGQLDFVATPTKDQLIDIFRETSTDPLVGWEDASVLRAKDLSIQETQLRHLYEEGVDLADLTNETAEEAKAIAIGIEGKVNDAVAAVAEAKDIANGAKDTAEAIDAKVDGAVSNSKAALEAANNAKEIAEGIEGKATQALGKSEDAVKRVGALETQIADLDLGDAETLKGSTKEEIGRVWRPSLSVVLGQVLYPTDLASPLAFECIQAGTTGTIEPKGVVMQAVTDGTAKWGIFDIRKRSPELDGSFELKNWTSPKTGYHVANGATLTSLSANYPSLYQALKNGEVPLVDKFSWQSLSSSLNAGIGAVPYFGYDGWLDPDVCYLPDVRNMYFRASGTYNVQDYHGDAIRNITGSFQAANATAFHLTSGAFIQAGTGAYPPASAGGGYLLGTTMYFNASTGGAITGPENVPKTIVQLPVVFTGYKVV